MLPGTAGLNEGGEAHLIHVILHNVWNDMEASIIVHCWAKSAILTITIDADIWYASRTKCATSQETTDLVKAFSKLLLPANSPSFDNLAENICGLASLQQQCSLDEIEEKLEQWSIIEESSDFVELLNKEDEECSSEDAFIASLRKEVSVSLSDEEIQDESVVCIEPRRI